MAFAISKESFCVPHIVQIIKQIRVEQEMRGLKLPVSITDI